jgi:hypothetical protein
LTFGDQLLLKFVEKCNVVHCPDCCTLFPVCLQAKFHPCPRKQTPTPCFMTYGSWTSFDVGNYCISIPWIVLRPLDHLYVWIKVSCVVMRRFKNPRDPTKIGQTGLWSKHSITILISIETFKWELSHF